MEPHSKKKPLTFGDFVAGSYRAWGKRRASGFIRLTLKSHPIGVSQPTSLRDFLMAGNPVTWVG